MEYQNVNGNIVLPEPYALGDTTFYTWAFASTKEHLEHICDNWFNNFSKDFVVRPISRHYLVSFAKYEGAKSTIPPFDTYGSVPYNESIVSFFVAIYRKTGKGEKLHQICAFAPYLFADSIFPIVQGREVYGMPKSMAGFEFPDPVEKNQKFSCSVDCLNPFSSETKVSRQNLIEISTEEHVDANEKIHHIGHWWNKEASHWLWPDLNFWKELEGIFFRGEMPFVALRQNRPVGESSNAVFSQIVTFNCIRKKLSDLSILPKATLQVEQNDMFPVAQDFGIGGDGLQSEMGIKVEWNFNFGNGSVLEEF
jgi:hypothetical protein